jgi:hypothetical protein
MKRLSSYTRTAIVVGLYVLGTLAAGCVVTEPREGYFDRDHARYWHNHSWADCGHEDEHCR